MIAALAPSPDLKLRPYQDEAIQKILAEHRRGIARQMLVLPTGCGKTVTFAELSRQFGFVLGRTPRVLVLAHREELVDQAIKTFGWVCPGMSVGKIRGATCEYGRDVTVATVQTLGRKDKHDADGLSVKLRRVAEKPFDLVVVDESHHSAADTYLRVLNAVPASLRLGVTATPNRADGLALRDVYDQITYQLALPEAVADGWLATPRGVRVNIGVDLDRAKVSRGDLSEGSLSKLLDTDEARSAAVAAWLEYAKGRRTIVFTCTVAHAEHLNIAFREAGVRSDVISGKTHRDDCAVIYRQLAEGEIDVLCSVMKLTEGFDSPVVDCVTLVRPTQSVSLLTQMIGRGLRLHPGKDDCLVLDVSGRSDKYTLVGLNMLGGFDSEDVEVREAEPRKPRDPSEKPNSGEKRYLFVSPGEAREMDLLAVSRSRKYEWSWVDWQGGGGWALKLGGGVMESRFFLLREHKPTDDDYTRNLAGRWRVDYFEQTPKLDSNLANGGYRVERLKEGIELNTAMAMCEQEGPRLGAQRAGGAPWERSEPEIGPASPREVWNALIDVSERTTAVRERTGVDSPKAALAPASSLLRSLKTKAGITESQAEKMTHGDAVYINRRGRAAGWDNRGLKNWVEKTLGAA